MAQITPAKKSAIGPEYITPSIPINNGITISKGKRNIICLVRDRKVPNFGLPIDVKKFEVIGCIKFIKVKNKNIWK